MIKSEVANSPRSIAEVFLLALLFLLLHCFSPFNCVLLGPSSTCVLLVLSLDVVVVQILSPWRPSCGGESSPGGGRSVLQGLWGRRTGHTGLGGWGVQPRGWSEFLAGPAGMDNRVHRPGGMGSPAQGVVGVSCRACGDVEPGTPARGDGRSRPGGGRSFLQGLWGWTTGPTGLGGRGVLPKGWSERPAGPVGA